MLNIMIRKRLSHLKSLIIADIHHPLLLARSVALGIYIAFSPFIGFHTVLVFLLGWLFSLSIPIIFAVSLLLHNPWTMFFVYAAGYSTGELFCSFFNIKSNFLEYYLQFVGRYVPFFDPSSDVILKILIGCNVLGVVIAVIVYPLIKYYAMQHKKS